MKSAHYCLSIALAAALTSAAAGAQAPAAFDSLDLTGRSAFTASVGLSGSRDAGLASLGAQSHGTGELASLAFAHWVKPEVAVEISTAVLGANASLGHRGTSSSAITPMLFGLSYSPRAFALSSAVRPYVSAAAGPYIHSTAGITANEIGASTESALGARVGAGADFFVASHFMLVVNADYHAISHFQHADETTMNAGGFTMSFGVGVPWGGRH